MGKEKGNNILGMAVSNYLKDKNGLDDIDKWAENIGSLVKRFNTVRVIKKKSPKKDHLLNVH
jgi:predicted transcriptional regulator